MLNDNRLVIVIGHYGSGKTEFAVNYAMKLVEQTDEKIALADLDIVNPYFRSREKASMLEEKGIEVISSQRGNKATNISIPMMSAGILKLFQNQELRAIIDVGGNSVGAKALGRYRKYLKQSKYDMFFVVNANREQTATTEGVIHHIKSIEAVTQAKVTGLINNTHLLRETTVEEVLKGQKIVEDVSKKLDIPVRYVSTLEKVAQQLSDETIEGEIFPIKMYMRDDWM
jgi:MinD-like ATPase involved in chromosome partitioning or flagellar assembly